MRSIILSLAYVAALFVAPHNAIAGQDRAAQAGACYNIQDADARAMCLARAHRDPGRCYSVQRPDLRAMCLAEARQ